MSRAHAAYRDRATLARVTRTRHDTVQWARVKVRVVGQVQGVSFHENAVANATSLGLSGWVKTEPDGSISLEIEGIETKVDALVDWCRQGPEGARVDNVVVLQTTATYERTPFIVKE